jgi:hypothetical protein
MRMLPVACLAALALVGAPARGGELKSGPEKKIGGSFLVTAVTGGNKGKTLCYV